MNPTYGIFFWMLIGGAIGWVSTTVQGADARQSPLVTVYMAMVGGVIGGLLGWTVVGQTAHDLGFLVSCLTALLGGVVGIFGWRRYSTNLAV